MQLFNVNYVLMLIRTGIPFSKSDKMQKCVEQTGYAITHHSHLRPIIPSMLQKELRAILDPLIEKGILFSLILDDTTCICEAFGLVIRWVENFVIYQKLIRISLLALAMTGRDTTCELVKIIIQMYCLDPSCVGILT